LEKVIKIGTRSNRVEEDGVSLLGVPEIQAVIRRIVEKVPLHAPCLMVHLLPLGTRVDVNFHLADVQNTFTGLQRQRRGADGEAARSLPEQHFLAVGRYVEQRHAVQYLFGLSLVQVET